MSESEEEKTPKEDAFFLENAKSGRSSCKKCRQKISKGELRIGHSYENKANDYTMTSYFHPECCALPAKLKKKGLNEEQFVTDLLQDNSDDGLLADDEFKESLVEKIVKASVKTPRKRVSGPHEHSQALTDEGNEHTAIARMKSNWNKLQGNEEDAIPAKKKKQKVKSEVKSDLKKEDVGTSSSASVDLSDEDKEAAEVYGYYSGMTNDELHDILRWNKQMVSGKKAELLERVIDGHLRGRLSKCPTCHKGQLRLDQKSDMTRVMCPGYFDEDAQVRASCLYSVPVDQAPRARPWFTEEPTEDQKKEMEDEQAKAADSKKDVIVSSMMSCLSNRSDVDWNLKNPKSIKLLAQGMVEICRETNMLNVPEDDKQAKMEIGKVLVQHKSESKEDVCGHLIDSLGIKQTKAEKKAVESTMESQCKVPGNGPLYAAFAELMNLYFKEGNSNAGASYRKVANAIRDLEFEVTEENAKGLCKGKTKVPGIGKGSADKAYEFVTTGKIEKLEEKKASM